ncbi:MAG: hypothetical protein M0Z36_08635 [Thermaerobacter sp.]|nr:hypothetical protein [Thermaerobacter sp.]
MVRLVGTGSSRMKGWRGRPRCGHPGKVGALSASPGLREGQALALGQKRVGETSAPSA